MKQRSAGLYRLNMVAAAPVVAHIDSLVAPGYSLSAVAAAVGIDVTHLRYIRTANRVTAKVAAKIMRVTAADLDPVQVPAVGVSRRMQALGSLGHSCVEIAALAGLPRAWVAAVRAGCYARIAAGRAEALVAVYDTLWNKPGCDTRTLTRAREAGWVPPLAWDDDTIDNPDAQPDGLPCAHPGCVNAPAVTGLCESHYAKRTPRDPDRRARVEALLREGLPHTVVAERTGVNARQVGRWSTQLRRKDVAA